tara:strand:+ start:92 stop:772 length:681 start_codon:yes stop_codon:yes gene_type:complete
MLAPLLLGVLCVGLLSTPRQAKATVYAIRLKDGSRIKGTLSMITPLRVVVQTPYGRLSLYRSEVESIYPPLYRYLIMTRRGLRITLSPFRGGVPLFRTTAVKRKEPTPRQKLITAGMSLFTLSYSLCLIPGLLSLGPIAPNLESTTLLIPLVGPFISTFAMALNPQNIKAFAALPLTLGVMQGLGLGLMIWGWMTPKKTKKTRRTKRLSAHVPLYDNDTIFYTESN